MSDPEEVTIVVHSAKGLKGKKSGRHKYSVIFGLGRTKFRTMVVKEPNGNPVWDEETNVPVSNVLDQVFFIVTEKDDILGQLTIPVTSLKAVKGQSKTAPLQPHKKCPNPQGFLSYQCFASKYRAPGDHLPIIKTESRVPDDAQPHSAFQRLRNRMASPSTQKQIIKKEQNGNKGSLSSFNKKISRSIQDLFSFSKFSARDSFDIDNVSTTSSQKSETHRNKNKKKFGLSFLSVSNNLDQIGTNVLITSCSPSSGPIDRPTRLTIEGQNLAIGKSDILSLKVAGCDCTDTLEFESSNRIYCTTHYYKVCKGPVEIDTISGGIGISKDGFSFYEELDDHENSSLNPDSQSNGSAFMDGSQGDCSIGGKEVKSGFSTVPRIKSTLSTPTGKPPTTSTPQPLGRYQKNHGRKPSEATSEVGNQSPKTPIEYVSKEELQSKINQLEAENSALKKDNGEMKRYIDKLVAKCIEHCPEALAQEDDERTRLFVLN